MIVTEYIVGTEYVCMCMPGTLDMITKWARGKSVSYGGLSRDYFLQELVYHVPLEFINDLKELYNEDK